MHEISLSHSIAMGHRIPGHEHGKGKCARLHGHTYKFEVTAKSPGLNQGFVIDFGHIKNMLNEWDHRTLLWDGDALHHLWPTHADLTRDGVLLVPFIPTAEAIAAFWADTIYADLLIWHQVEHEDLPADQEAYAVMVEVWESPTSSARHIRR